MAAPRTQLHGAMHLIRDIYEGTVKIDLPDLDKSMYPAVPNLLGQGIDQMAARIASTLPMPFFAPQFPDRRTSQRRAMTANRVISGWWQSERLKIKQQQRARHLIAYGMSPCVVIWDAYLKRPVRQVRSPLETFPNPETVAGTFLPVDCLFAYRRSVGYLIDSGYAGQISAVTGRMMRDLSRDDTMMLLEYIDADGRMLVLTGTLSIAADPTLSALNQVINGSTKYTLLEWAPMKEHYCTAVVPTRVSLDKPMGQFTTVIGMYFKHARMMALEELAVEKGIFPDTWIESNPAETARIIRGPYDGRTGEINILAGGRIHDLQTQPGYMTPQTIDRLERNIRVTAGLPMEFSGESGTNVRTGRRGDTILSNVIDFPIAEAQDMFAAALEDENRVAIALAKMYDGDNARTIYVGAGNETRSVTYVANEIFPTSEHTVVYPVTGADTNALIIGLEQRGGAGTMSKQTQMRLDPFVADPEAERPDHLRGPGAGADERAAAAGGRPPARVRCPRPRWPRS
jgi:hypothetical protein